MPLETKDLEPVITGIGEIKAEQKTNATAVTEVKTELTTVKTEVTQTKAAVETIQTETKDLKDWRVKKDEADVKRDAAIDKFSSMSKRSPFGGGMNLKSFESEIEEVLTKNADQLKARTKFNVQFERKAVGDLGSGNLTGSYFITPDTRTGVILKPYETVHLRNLLPIGRTASNVIRYVRDNGGEGVPAPTAMGSTKPQIDRDLSIEDANVRKIAAYIRVPEEMIEDIDYMTSFLTNMGTNETLKVEDSQIVYGDGTGQNLSGLFTNATAFSPGASALVSAPNRFDVLRAARMQLRKAFRVPSFALVSPTDYYIMTSAKDSTNNYILQGGGNGLIPNLDGVPIIESTTIQDGDFLIGDRMAAEIDFRTNLTVRFFEQDQNNAIQNMVTIVVEERLALPIYYTTGFVKGTFDAAIGDINAGS